jgi:hypothetical protein
VAGRPRRDVRDDMLAVGTEVAVVRGPHRLAGLLMSPARRLAALVPARQRRSGSSAAGEEIGETGQDPHDGSLVRVASGTSRGRYPEMARFGPWGEPQRNPQSASRGSADHPSATW